MIVEVAMRVICEERSGRGANVGDSLAPDLREISIRSVCNHPFQLGSS